MAHTRSGPRGPGNELTHLHDNQSDSESSSEDEEGIPAKAASRSPSKRPSAQFLPPVDTTSYQSSLKRPSATPDLIFYPGPLKKRKVRDSWGNPRGARPYPTPVSTVSTHAALVATDTTSGGGSASGSTTGDEVPAGLINRLNAALHQPLDDKTRWKDETPETPTHQLLGELNPEDEDEAEARIQPENQDEIPQQGDRGTVAETPIPDLANGVGQFDWQQNNALLSGLAEEAAHEREPPISPESSLFVKDMVDEEDDVQSESGSDRVQLTFDQQSHNHTILGPKTGSGYDQDGVDVWDIPQPPEQPQRPEEHAVTDSLEGTRSRTRQNEKRRAPGESPGPQLATVSGVEAGASVDEEDVLHTTDNQQDRSQHGDDQEDAEDHLNRNSDQGSNQGSNQNVERNADDEGSQFDDTGVEEMDDIETGDESYADIELSAEESFGADVQRFRTMHRPNNKEAEIFTGPAADDLIAIHLDQEPLREMCKLMRNTAWTGFKGGWQWRPLSFDDDAKTKPAKTILQLLSKLERLYSAAPKAPHIAEQNEFLHDHADLLSHYFSEIKLAVDNIREQRLASMVQNKSPLNCDAEKRKSMATELVQLVIPMMIHILVQAWSLGGRNWFDMSFTAATTECLRRAVGWIRNLYRPLLVELKRRPLKKRPKNKSKQNSWRETNEAREELEPLIEDLRKVISNAPDELWREERRITREREDRCWSLKRQEEIKLERKLEAEARRRDIEERKTRSLMSMRGIHYPLGSLQDSTPRVLPASPSPRPSPGLSEWSFEQKLYLFRQIQRSCPNLPDMDNICWQLDKTAKDVEDMAAQQLGMMLEAVEPDTSAESRGAEVRRIMHSHRISRRR
ncbi:Uu.00g127240.m01.CDS01 [Anthostomella pinea]|uniref:Uu.00g127240.m01.CDS01 n=1 Tax=Anthostomella pinea TaxID=933095 RepID=A0AAI8VI40_9PEZI|nr:Uu.00g127240.m01.CDS01 [Anthostomella pinea]